MVRMPIQKPSMPRSPNQHAARLATAREHYDAARKLIDETGYHRCDGELRTIADGLLAG